MSRFSIQSDPDGWRVVEVLSERRFQVLGTFESKADALGFVALCEAD